MKTLNTPSTANQADQLNNTVVAPSVTKTSFGVADLWSIQRNRRVRVTRKLIF
jgi:hypothetical protein